MSIYLFDKFRIFYFFTQQPGTGGLCPPVVAKIDAFSTFNSLLSSPYLRSQL